MRKKRITLHGIINTILTSINFPLAIITTAFVSALLYGTIGTYYLRGQFVGIHSYNDAFYFTVVTFATLGDNIIHPITTEAKYFVITILVFGFGIFATFASIIFYQIVHKIGKMINKFHGGKKQMKNHIILCGYSLITELLIHRYQKDHIPFVLLDNKLHPELNSSEDGNFIYVSVPSRIENLIKANIALCKVIIASSDLDSENILAGINAGRLREKFTANFEVIVRILYEENLEIAKNNGANHVISPTMMEALAITELTN